ncbi:response regulator transcription factor [Parvicella tangerina]|uniref:Transcriptional regulatory protein DegU n=1 Tax=Parvicella tangerina TaxID=2829795 RepID=A0A916JJ55_9FLAO|nr:response regulator transcription factor [Parvicella tangerina]CAG5076490.1 Transcriptional regulatory protein DegU [Parvicella tangerina]
MDKKLVVFIADDHELVRQGVSGILESSKHIETVRSFSDGRDLYKAILNEKPDCIFLDIEMPNWDGLKTLREIKTNFPEIPCIMLSMLEERSVIEECVVIGASGYLHKDSSKEELEEAIIKSLEGKVFFSEEANKILTGQRNRVSSSGIELTEPLTHRELEILEKICDGLTSKEIGEQLFVSHRTVEAHKKNLMQKFNVNTTGKLIALALKNRIVK